MRKKLQSYKEFVIEQKVMDQLPVFLSKKLTEEQLYNLIDIIREDVKNQESKNEGRGIWRDKWDKDDLILTYYFSTYGTKGLGLTDRELAQDVIGSSLNSLKMQASNYDHLKGLTGLDRPHSTQTEIYNEFHDKTQGELMKICRNIIDKKGGGDGKVFQDKIRQRNMKKDLDNELVKRGFDPKKMKSLGKRPTLQSMLEEPEITESIKWSGEDNIDKDIEKALFTGVSITSISTQLKKEYSDKYKKLSDALKKVKEIKRNQ